MHKKPYALLLLLCLALGLTACSASPKPTDPPTGPTAGQSTGDPTTDAPTTGEPTEATTEEPTAPAMEEKILLKLQLFDLESKDYEGTYAETEENPILLNDLSLPETELNAYESDSFLAPIYRTGLLTYTYNIFYRHTKTGIIDNAYGTEMVIE